MNKKKVVMLLIVVIVITATVTVGLMTFIPLKGKVLISYHDFENYRYIMNKYGKLFELKDYIDDNYYIPVNEEDIMRGLYKGLFQGLGDPYSSYLTSKEYEDLMISSQGEFQGIGVTVYPADTGYITVVAPFSGSPADLAGIKGGDKIVKVDGVEYSAEEMEIAVSKMRGQPGTSVKITVMREGESGLLDFNIMRANVKIVSVESELLEDGLGYIRIVSFDENTADDFKNHLRNLDSQDISGLIIDLRNNPGGLVSESIEIADMLLGKETIIYTEDNKGNKRFYESDREKTEIPYVILVNESSASASEILAAAIKDSGEGKIIGTRTFGKGIIQRIQPLENGDGVKITIAQYFSPKGDIIHDVGVEPNILVELDEEVLESGLITKENDKQLKRAMEVLKR
ncbi:MAG: S41 family peptidase [Peptostreptococcales bacterium]